MKIRNLSLAVVAAVPLLGAAVAQAGPTQNVRVTIPAAGGASIVVRNFDWLESGSGVAIGAGPFAVAPPSTFLFLYQAALGSFTNAIGTPVARPPGLNASAGTPAFTGNAYEFTIAARIEEVLDPGSSPTNFVFNATSGYISIFYDDATRGGTPFNVGAGTGFDDGIEIARLSIRISQGTSNFSINPLAGSGIGGTTYFFDRMAGGDFVNPAFIQGLTTLGLDLHFQSSQTFPPGTSTTTSFHSSSATGGDIYPTYLVDLTGVPPPNGRPDLLLKVDGSSAFGTVPEPGTVLLLGGGLLGLGFAGRRALKSSADV